MTTAAAAAALAVPISSASPTPERAGRAVVRVVDFDYSQPRLSIGSGDRIDLRWSLANMAPHNVTLRAGPAGVDRERFESRTAWTRVKFEPVFDVAGK